MSGFEPPLSGVGSDRSYQLNHNQCPKPKNLNNFEANNPFWIGTNFISQSKTSLDFQFHKKFWLSEWKEEENVEHLAAFMQTNIHKNEKMRKKSFQHNFQFWQCFCFWWFCACLNTILFDIANTDWYMVLYHLVHSCSDSIETTHQTKRWNNWQRIVGRLLAAQLQLCDKCQ